MVEPSRSIILPGQSEATVAAHPLLDLSELSKQEVFTSLTGHPVAATPSLAASLPFCHSENLSASSNGRRGSLLARLARCLFVGRLPVQR